MPRNITLPELKPLSYLANGVLAQYTFEFPVHRQNERYFKTHCSDINAYALLLSLKFLQISMIHQAIHQTLLQI